MARAFVARAGAFVVVIAAAVFGNCACRPTPPPPSKPAIPIKEPMFDGTGTYSRAIETKSADAQRYFDQGLRFLYGFNHDEAIRSFQQAQAFDDTCVMCFLGEALANGPHINNPDLDEAHRAAGLAAARRASQAWHALHSERTAGGVELALCEMLQTRFQPATAERTASSLTELHALSMRTLSEAEPADADVAALAAEATLDERPWDQWTSDGKAQPGTEDVIKLLDRALARAPEHPLANHLAVHVWEASPTPERGEVSAERLRTMAPALAHLVHMPTHIDVRRGRFAQAIKASQAALAADAAYLARVPQQGFYRFYVAHNEHMLAYAAMMTGQRALALSAIERMVKDIPDAWLQENAAVADGITALPLEVKMRFGLWDELLQAPEPAPELPIARALRHAARAVAYAAKHDVAHAKIERASLDADVAALPAGARFGNNDAAALLRVASALADGEIAVAADHIDDGVKALRAAAEAEDALRYDEPPDWLQPARHALGAVLLNAGRAKEAEAVYREDLARVPDNGWSLLGLAQSLEAQKRDAAAVRKRFEAVWRDADVAISTSCLCQQRPR